MSHPRLSAVELTPPGKPLCVATLAVGAEAGELLALSGPRFAAYAGRVGADYRVLTGPDSAYPLGYKFALARLLGVYERVIFFDADVVLAGDCPDLFRALPPGRLAMHDDWEYLPRREWLLSEYLNLIKSQGWTGLMPPESCFNTGVVVASAAHRAAFERPAKPFPGTHTAEQSLVNLNIRRHRVPVTGINWELNWQWWADRGRRRTAGVKIWHFASAPHAERLKLMRAALDGTFPPAPPAAAPAPPGRFSLNCRFRGGPTGETRSCRTCGGLRDVPLHACAVHGVCTTERMADGVKWCRVCTEKQAPPA